MLKRIVILSTCLSVVYLSTYLPVCLHARVSRKPQYPNVEEFLECEFLNILNGNAMELHADNFCMQIYSSTPICSHNTLKLNSDT